MFRGGSLLVLALSLSACREEETVVMTFDEEPAAKVSDTAPSGESVDFDRPPTHKASVEALPAPTKIEPTAALPVVKQETAAADPHAKVPNYKELGEAHKREKLEAEPQALFLNHCSSCHSYDGTGHIKKMIAGIPDLTSASVQQQLKDAQIYKAIANGHGGAAGYGSLFDGDQINGIVAHVRTLQR